MSKPRQFPAVVVTNPTLRSLHQSGATTLPEAYSGQLLVQLYSKLATALSVPGIVGKDSKSILSIHLPGLDIRPGLDPRDPETQYYVANALDSTLACNWTLIRRAATISEVYRSILDGKETPLLHLTPEQAKELENAEAYLIGTDGEPTRAYAEYSAFELAYLEALDDYEGAAATAANGGAPIPHHIVQRRIECEERWRAQGHKREVESALRTIEQLEGWQPARFWSDLAARFRQYTREAGSANHYQYVDCNPRYEHWFDPLGWAHFSYDQDDFANQRRAGGVGAGDGACCCCCQRGAGPDAGRLSMGRAAPAAWASLRTGEAEESPIFVDAAPFAVNAKIRRVQIIRPWMDSNVFYNRVWRWAAGSIAYGTTISTGGDIAGSQPPSGLMTVLPHTAILASDIDIVWDDSGRTLDRVRQSLAQGDRVRFGPFELSRSSIAGGHIKAAGPQLIGFISSIIPECPNPDPLLPWPVRGTDSGHWPI